MIQRECKEDKVLMDTLEIIKKYSTKNEREILDELSEGSLKEKAKKKTLKKLIHNQHGDFIK